MHKSKDAILFDVLAKIIVGMLAIFCLIPFLLVLSGSVSTEEEILRHGYSVFPRGFSMEAYRFVAENPRSVLNAYGITVFVTAAASAAALLLISMTAYVLYRKDFRYRNVFSFFFYFTTLFNGGMLPTYILVVRYLHLKDNLLALILPGIFNVFFLLIMRNFMTGNIPDSLMESSKIDGAGDFYIYWRIVLPLMKPALATIGLFEAIAHWNNWYSAMLYIRSESLFPLQYVLYRLLQTAQAVAAGMNEGATSIQLPTETLKLSMTVIAIGPIILAYPFAQKYFVSGITIGAVKG